MMENAIRNQLANQLITEQITRSELEEALIKISDEEMLTIERPIHSQLVTACHSIIYQLNGIEMPSDHSLTESVIRVSRKIARRSRIQTSLQFGMKVAAVLICISMAAIIHDHLANRNLLHGDTIENGSQYRIEGDQPADTLIDRSNATQNIQRIYLSTTDITEIKSILGYTPKTPSWIPDGWNFRCYALVSSEQSTLFTATYEHPDFEQALIFSSQVYAQPDSAAATYEQDNEGHYETWNNQNVYLTTNMGGNMAIWVDGIESCSIGGPVSLQQIRSVFNSIE